MIISVVNRARSLHDEDVLRAIRAINRQLHEDFAPYWSLAATLRLEAAIGKTADQRKLPELRGDAVLYLCDGVGARDALAYHCANFRGIPYGFVFTGLCKQLGDSWTAALSHEALELLADARANLLVRGPHPVEPRHQVFHWFELCDPVQTQHYEIDGVEVCNFVLPLYFTPKEEAGGRNDFLGRLSRGKGLKSFGVSPGGYIGFFDPRKQANDTWFAPGDRRAKKRIELKARARVGRGFVRRNSDGVAAREDEHLQVLTAADRPDGHRKVAVTSKKRRA
ncbi:hypothetical protein [Solimonas terrae]|uniref:Uncharacterized protein n=1 Tax=Solimonas terrae TaxID=1396819 RepID=A0A6M2BP35_9GAMM|nr:hypothetical protein [Solimonas terrae]NGY04080.1 hypothetical protein [Solimonas terrae]